MYLAAVKNCYHPGDVVCDRANDNAEQVLSQGEYLRVSGLLHEMLCSVCEQAHDRCHKLLIARSKVLGVLL